MKQCILQLRVLATCLLMGTFLSSVAQPKPKGISGHSKESIVKSKESKEMKSTNEDKKKDEFIKSETEKENVANKAVKSKEVEIEQDNDPNGVPDPTVTPAKPPKN